MSYSYEWDGDVWFEMNELTQEFITAIVEQHMAYPDQYKAEVDGYKVYFLESDQPNTLEVDIEAYGTISISL